MHLDRLEKLIDVLKRVEELNLPFDMASWLDHRAARLWADGHQSPCQTTACALGYAALDPYFQSLGLRLAMSREPEKVFLSAAAYNAAIRDHDCGFSVVVWFEDQDAFRAGMTLFDIPYDAACFLFDPDQYQSRDVGPRDVIDRVRAVIFADGEMPARGEDCRDEDC